jgi:hypothetical protein
VTVNGFGSGGSGTGGGGSGDANGFKNATTTPLCGSGTVDFTIEGWIKIPTAHYAGSDYSIFSQWTASGAMVYGTGSGGYDVFRDGSSLALSTAISNDNSWHHIVGQKSGSTGNLYVDGALVTTGSLGGATVTNPAISADIAGYNGEQRGPLPGFMDETRVSTTARSADWILAEYNNQFIPDKNASASGFYTFGSESGGAVSQVPYQNYYQPIVTQ